MNAEAQMNAVVCEQPQRLAFTRKQIPARRPDEALIRVRRVGICGTDMHILRGTQPYLTYPRVMGHELAGEWLEGPANSRFKPGEPVYVMPYFFCGKCPACRAGLTNCCQRIEVLGVHRDGGLAEYLAVPERFLGSAEGISLDEAAMIEFLAIGAHAAKRAKISARANVLVVGAGPIGMAVLLAASHEGARVSVVDTREDRLAFCSARLAAAHTLTASDRLPQQLAEITRGEMFDVVFDATGDRAAMEAGFEFVAHGGTYVLLSVVKDRISFSDPEFHRREMTLIGSRNATPDDFERVLGWMRAGRIPTRELNTHRTRLDQLAQVLPQWMSPAAGVIKGLVEC